MFRPFVSAAAVAVCLTVGAHAQNWQLDPTYGTVTLQGGVTPDPYTLELLAGGDQPASNADSGCVGHIADAPDLRVHFEPGDRPLIISVDAATDTSLVVNTPDGAWHCDDDGGQGFNPSLSFDDPQSGQYDIWVGVYGGPSLEPATLHISETISQ